MRFLAATAALSGFLGLAAARIEGFAVPKEIKPGDEFDAILMGFNYIQSVDEVAAAFGVAAGDGYPGSLGTVIESVYLGPEKSNEIANYTFPVTVPSEFELGEYTWTTSLFRLYGAADSPSHEEYSVKVTLGEETSDEYIRGLATVPPPDA